MAAFLNKHELVATLLSRGVDVNAAGHYYGTALQAAARHGHNDMALQLISAGAQVNILQGQWETALRAAIVGGHEDVVRTLLHNGADFNLGSKFETSNHRDISSSYLQLAVRTDKIGIVTAILEAGAVPSDDESDRMGEDVDQPPLIISAQRGNLETTKALIDSGANINSVGRKMGSSILYDEHASPLCAAIAKKRRKVAKLLLEHGADVKQTVEGCKSPLSLAVEVEDQSLVRHLLKHGANIDTVLTEAAEHNHLGIIQDLVAAAVKAGTDQTYWTNPIIAALKKPYCGEVKDIQIVKVLLEALMDTPDPGPVIEEALSKAIEEENSKVRKRERLSKWPQDIHNNPPTIEFPKFHRCEQIAATLLDYGSSPVSAAKSAAGPPLHLACLIESKQTVVRLLEKGANVNEIGGHFEHALPIAIAANRPDLVAILLQHGADPNYLHEHYGTPLQLANTMHSTLSVKHLLEHGADVVNRDADGNHLPLE
ncbi:hypothetical protein CEP52_006706 [Fusarium oligoseptatum]|uniref:Uncharacterized protein n=1 Tax=Fusarium oligoseptatum TaxID=2604345 RepID=A0A428TRA7_9HYPO|nr:hypothetical protein CEP52_006706 [Fusarium oligoseptatum]